MYMIIRIRPETLLDEYKGCAQAATEVIKRNPEMELKVDINGTSVMIDTSKPKKKKRKRKSRSTRHRERTNYGRVFNDILLEKSNKC